MGKADESNENSSPKGLVERVRAGLGLIKELAGILIAFFAIVGIIDWRVKSVVESEEYIGRIARNVRPYVIFDEKGSILVEGGAMQYLVAAERKPMEVKVLEERGGKFQKLQITVRPNEYLANPPLVQALSSHEGLMLPNRGQGYEWIYDFDVAGYIGGDNQVRFRLEIMK